MLFFSPTLCRTLPQLQILTCEQDLFAVGLFQLVNGDLAHRHKHTGAKSVQKRLEISDSVASSSLAQTWRDDVVACLRKVTSQVTTTDNLDLLLINEQAGAHVNMCQ